VEKMVFKRIKSNLEIDEFLTRFENYVGVKLPNSYAIHSKIVGIFLQERLVGGYMLVTGPNLRSVMFLPDSIKKSSMLFNKDPYEFMEVNGLWMSPAIKTAKQQFRVWMHILIDIFITKKRYIMLMGDAKNSNIRKIHHLTSPTNLFIGKPILMAGETTHEEICVSYTTRWRMLLGLRKYRQEYREREKRESMRAHRLVTSPANHDNFKHIDPEPTHQI